MDINVLNEVIKIKTTKKKSTKKDGLKTEVDGLKTEVDGLKTEVDGLKTEVDTSSAEPIKEKKPRKPRVSKKKN